MEFPTSTADTGRGLQGLLGRWVGFVVFWLILTGFNLPDLPAGMIAAVIAAWVSLRLLPGQWRLRPVLVARFLLRFLRQSIAAGFNTAWRALDPRLPLRPGFAIYRPRYPAGPMRNAFCTVTSLLPGTLPCGSNDRGDLVIHCLDVEQPVARQLSEEEERLILTFGGIPDHG